MAKTGSTSIQVTMAAVGRRDGFAFVQAGAANAAKALAIAFMDNPLEFPAVKRLGMSPKALQAERSNVLEQFGVILASGAETFLLSTEMLSQFDKQTLRALRRWLLERVDAIQLIGYVRPIRSYLDSMFSQSLRNGNGSFDLAQRYPGFRDRLHKLEVVFGKGNVLYRTFDPLTLREGCVVQDLAEFVGLQLVPGEVQRVNDGLSKDASSLLYAYRKLGPGYGVGPKVVAENIRLAQRLQALQGPKLRLARHLVDPLLQAQVDDLAWVEGRLGRSIAGEAAVAPDGDTVSSEEDLLTFSHSTLVWLADQSAAPADVYARILSGRAQDVADAMEALRHLPAPGHRRAERRSRGARPVHPAVRPAT